jgi:hypothetical protein
VSKPNAKYSRKPLRTAIRDLDAQRELRPLSQADLRRVAGGGSAGMCTDTAQCDDVPTIETF